MFKALLFSPKHFDTENRYVIGAKFGVSPRHAIFPETKIKCDLYTGSSLQVS